MDKSKSAHSIQVGESVFVVKEDAGKLIGIHYHLTNKGNPKAIKAEVVDKVVTSTEVKLTIKVENKLVKTHSELTIALDFEK
jgi:hypothetical protein